MTGGAVAIRTHPMPTDDLVSWVHRARSGETEAFRLLVSRCSNAVLSVAYGVLGDMDAARDVTQESFLKAYQSLGTLQKPEAFESWLLSIARNRAHSALRRRGREAVAMRELKRRAALRSEPAEDPFNRPGESDALLHEALEALDAEDREILTLRHVAGAGVEAAAKLLELSVDGVKSRLSRARRKLWEALERARKRDEHK